MNAAFSFHNHDHGEKLGLSNSALQPIIKALKQLLSDIYKAKQMPQQLDANTVTKMADKLYEGVEQGYGDKLINLDYDTPDYDMLSSLKKDTWQFSGAKNYQQMKAMTEALLGPDGKLRSFGEFKKAVKPIIDDHVGWLRTEYQTAIASSQMAAKWVRIQKDKDIFPLLQFDAVMDNRTTELCSSLNLTVKPIDDPFWDVYYPPNHFNCRSDVRQLRDGVVTKDENINYPDIPDMFRTNVSKQGLVFPSKSSYYKGLPEDIKIQSSRLLAKQIRDWGKKNLVGKNFTAQKIGKVTVTGNSLKEILHKNHAQYELKNMAVYDLPDIIKDAKFIRTEADTKGNAFVKAWHYLEFQLGGKSSYLNVREDMQGNKVVYAITDKLK